jgi:hypothetical protein
VLIGIVVGLLTASGVAAAVWLLTGSGSGFARGGTAQNLTTLSLTGGAVPGELAPGLSAPLRISIVNPNGFPVTITALDAGAGPVISSDPGNCAGTNVNIIPLTGLSVPVAANANGTVIQIPGGVFMVSGAPNACQGVLFELPITLQAQSA